MNQSQDTNRQVLLDRGWYVVTGVETAFLGLSGRAHDVLILIKHFQGDDPAAFPTRERLAQALRASVSTVQRALNELARKGVLASRRTGRASHRSVRYCRATVAEIKVLLGGDIDTSDVPTGGTSDVSDLTHPLPYKNHLPRTTQEPLPSGGGDAQAPQETTGEDRMGRQGMRPSGVIMDELDPTAALGLWESQEEPTPPRRSGKTPAQRDSAMGLAFEFEKQVRGQSWAGPSPVNKAALAKNLSAWKRDGLTADQIRRMMALFVREESFHRPGKAPWIAFVGLRHILLVQTDREAKTTAMNDYSDQAATDMLSGTPTWADRLSDEERAQWLQEA